MLRRTKLSTGLDVLINPNDSMPSIGIALKLGFGTRDDPITLAGLHHTAEHMSVRGSRKFPNKTALLRQLERAGGSFNAFVDKSQTVFYCIVPPDHLGFGLDILSQLVFEPLLREDDWTLERAAMLHEQRDRRMSPDRVLTELFLETVFPGQPMAISGLGSEDSINRIQISDIQNMYRTALAQSQVQLFLTGNLPGDAVAEAETVFSNRVVAANPTKRVETLPNVAGKRWHLEHDLFQSAHVRVGQYASPVDHEQGAVYLVLQNMLGTHSMLTSPLFLKIREEKQLCYSLGLAAGVQAPGLLYRAFVCKCAPKDKEEVVEQFWRVLGANYRVEDLFEFGKERSLALLSTLEFDSSSLLKHTVFDVQHDCWLEQDQEIRLVQAVSHSDVISFVEEIFTRDQTFEFVMFRP